MISEKQFLGFTEREKNTWIVEHILPETKKNIPNGYEPAVLNWASFGMIVKKMQDEGLKYSFRYDGEDHLYKFVCMDGHCHVVVDQDKIWEAAALSYGKMKGLIKE